MSRKNRNRTVTSFSDVAVLDQSGDVTSEDQVGQPEIVEGADQVDQPEIVEGANLTGQPEVSHESVDLSGHEDLGPMMEEPCVIGDEVINNSAAYPHLEHSHPEYDNQGSAQVEAVEVPGVSVAEQIQIGTPIGDADLAVFSEGLSETPKIGRSIDEVRNEFVQNRKDSEEAIKAFNSDAVLEVREQLLSLSDEQFAEVIGNDAILSRVKDLRKGNASPKGDTLEGDGTKRCARCNRRIQDGWKYEVVDGLDLMTGCAKAYREEVAAGAYEAGNAKASLKYYGKVIMKNAVEKSHSIV